MVVMVVMECSPLLFVSPGNPECSVVSAAKAALASAPAAAIAEPPINNSRRVNLYIGTLPLFRLLCFNAQANDAAKVAFPCLKRLSSRALSSPLNPLANGLRTVECETRNLIFPYEKRPPGVCTASICMEAEKTIRASSGQKGPLDSVCESEIGNLSPAKVSGSKL